jgi:DNA ligase 1
MKIYTHIPDFTNHTMSEKFDGINATWDGKQLISRDGNPFPAPDWFVADLPAARLVGELWVGRAMFQALSSIVKNLDAGKRWRDVRYLVFDNPSGLELGKFAGLVEQYPCINSDVVDAFYSGVLAEGGEGIIIRDPAGVCVKRKPITDDDAEVIGHIDGKGRHVGRLGALLVRDRDGREFRLGTGLTDAERRNPPSVGSFVTFKFQGRTAAGIPRFAAFVGRRTEECFV